MKRTSLAHQEQEAPLAAAPERAAGAGPGAGVAPPSLALPLEVTVPSDGSVALAWRTPEGAATFHLLAIRTGGVPAYTALQLARGVGRFELANLSRHQRYQLAVLATANGAVVASPWLSVTPRAGLLPTAMDVAPGVEPYLASIERLTVMPQDQRLTVFWRRGRGFVDKLLLEVTPQGSVPLCFELEPEVTSLSLDARRGLPLTNGLPYSVRLAPRFATLVGAATASVVAIPAPQGEERRANAQLPQQHLIYASLSVAPELCIFPEDEAAAGAVPAAEAPQTLVCVHCGREVAWRAYQLVCSGCGAEFIPNGRGDYLEVSRLRFGTCRCCLPKKILVQRQGAEGLACAHSGKEHIALADRRGYALIEDLPYGLCQCCRPRRPLVKKGEQVRCSKSDEEHCNENGAWVLRPSALVFDARAIDDLMDAGLAEICATGVSKRRAR